MKFDTMLFDSTLETLPARVQTMEAMGFDGLWTLEAAHNPFLPLALAAEHSTRLTLGTAIAVAFPRTPTVLAHLAWDLARFSKGRFILGLGPQVKAHNERRLGVKWEKPVAKLRETILAIRALWDCWQNGSKLNFRGEFFNLKLMTPFFNPGPIEHPDIPIFIAGVNRRMITLAGELCDGLHVHALHTRRYLQDFVLPTLEAGAAKAGRTREDVTLSTGVFVIPTDDPDQAAQFEAKARRELAFYLSTPSYRILAELHGWTDIAEKLSHLARWGKWDEMPALLTDEMMDALTVRGTWADLPAAIRKRYEGGLMDRVSYYLPFTPGENDAGWRATIAGFKQAEPE
ncbi:MAG: TIGR03617 family F420-dependent LLM class oxidoreductase [Caldilineae bacterium]|nr:MAG: TIGR03617 family F420-dependent LLM class oxidoreductase [Caldilineae bacterium]